MVRWLQNEIRKINNTMYFKIIALLLMAAFYACYYIKLFGQKRKGIKTTQIGREKTGFVKFIECTMMVSTVLAVIAELFSIALGTSSLPVFVRWLGAGIGALGVAVFIVAVITMRDSWRAGVSKTEKTKLVTNGIFRISRNPAFLGFDLLYIGILLMFFNWILFAISFFAALMFHLQIVNVEEDYLLEAFEDEYLSYKKKVNRYIGRKPKNKKKTIICVICIILAIPLIVLPILSAVIYESNFDSRYETVSWMRFSVEDYEDLQMERSNFQSGDVTLAGYKYFKPEQDVKGVVVIAHGLGGGGHNTYMPFVDYFTTNGYYVFAYDARGNDNSEGNSVRGLPQGLIDLDNAIHHLVAVEEYIDLPIFLFGHSWGGYAVGNVLNMHPDVKAAVIIAGFNQSADLLQYQGEQMIGTGIYIFMPYLKLYERIKFGEEYTATSAVEGMRKTDADIMVIHSKDDTAVPTKYGYDKFYENFSDSDRFRFVLYENKGHNYLFCSDAALEYREQLNADYKAYVEEQGGEYNAEIKERFMTEHLDKKKCFEPDPELMEQILELYGSQN